MIPKQIGWDAHLHWYGLSRTAPVRAFHPTAASGQIMKEKNTNNPGLQDEIWTALRQKWTRWDAEGHTIKVDFQLLNDPANATKVLAIDVAQKVDGEWVVQTVQRQPKEAYGLLRIEGLNLEQLRELATQTINSLVGLAAGEEASKEEVHLFLKWISPASAEVHGYVLSKSGEKISLRTNYQHYYVLNEILEQTSQLHGERYSGLEAYRNADQSLSFRFLPA